MPDRIDFHAVENDIASVGSLAAALGPKQAADGTWVFNQALSSLDLSREGWLLYKVKV